jgi:hypothetical protein
LAELTNKGAWAIFFNWLIWQKEAAADDLSALIGQNSFFVKC